MANIQRYGTHAAIALCVMVAGSLIGACGPAPARTPTAPPTHDANVAATSAAPATPSSRILLPTSAPLPTAVAGVTRVSIGENYFYPAEVTIKRGESVEWLLTGARTHFVTSYSNAWESVYLNPGGHFEHTFGKPGTYHYFCGEHSGMEGVIEVAE